MIKAELLSAADSAITQFSDGSADGPQLAEVQNIVSDVFRAIAPNTANNLPADATLADIIEAIAESNEASRDFVMFTLRVIGDRRLLNACELESTPHFKRRVVGATVAAAPEIGKFLKLDNERQTNEKFGVLAGVHDLARSKLSLLSKLPRRANAFASNRQAVFKILGDTLLKSYLNGYDYSQRAEEIRHIYNEVCDLVGDVDIGFVRKLTNITEHVAKLLAEAGTQGDFVARLAYVPFLETAQEVINEIESESAERFKCTIRPRRLPPHVVERRFPLHESNRILRVSIPLMNEGPGTAVNVAVTVVSESKAAYISNERLDIDAVEPGEFAISLEILLGDPQDRVPMLVEVEWSTARETTRQNASFDAVLLGQNRNVDWEELEATDPYSTDVAEGRDFVGRQAKVMSIANRLLKPRMQSTYITGQKRVGKTSLSLAVRDFVTKNPLPGYDTEFLYLEYGDYAGKDADSTVERLGRAIASGLLSHLPYEDRPVDLDFAGSLAPLSLLSQKLLDRNPNKRFVIILDEFDEINPDMYRFGPLAEAFFSNLRTLSAKQNLAMILIGGENMPFIISAQGDQLNKFIREPLDYFNRSSEWVDFTDLIRLRGLSPLNWHESALHEIYRLSNGHPYYAKLICSRIFQSAIAERDTDVTVEEVSRSLVNLTETLDTNAFAHFWKDGIPNPREEAEVTELKRRRALVAVAQAIRQNHMLNLQNIANISRSCSLAHAEVHPLLTDFVRRDILRERGREYEFVLPLFEHWLVQQGVGKLITDQLGDQIAEAVRVAEDEAFVRDKEVVSLVENWPVYRGRRIGLAEVRAWLDQCESMRDRRLLFTLLKGVRFVGEEEARGMLVTAHSIVKRHTTAFTPDTRSHRRFDLVVTYVDGPGKSGAKYASKYAEENLISATSVVEQADFPAALRELEKRRDNRVNGVVLIDDLVATGGSLSGNLKGFIERNRALISERGLPIVAVSLLATREGDDKVRSGLGEYSGIDIDFRACEILPPEHFPFGGKSKLWDNDDQQGRAKELVTRLGQAVCNTDPLGFGGSSLLVVFSETCPNNTLPILHASNRDWRPLFPRPKN